MRKLQKFLSLSLVLVLLLSLTSPVMAMGQQVKLSMKAEQASVAVGELVSIQIRTEDAFQARGCGLTIYYDPTILSPELSRCEAAVPFTVSGPVVVNGKTALRISFVPGLENHAFGAGAVLVTLCFKTLDAAKKTTVSMGTAFLYDASLQEMAVTMASDVDIAVQRGTESGYTVTMPADASLCIGDTVQIPVTIGHADGKTGYNAFDISFTYDEDVLELVTTKLPGLTIFAEDGRINVLGYGESREAGSVPFVLQFKAVMPGDGRICITSARVDNSENAVIQNASQAKILDGETKILVTGYPVSLPSGFTGTATAMPETDYTFCKPDDAMDYSVTATVSGKTVPVEDNGDRSYTILGTYVTGPIVVTANRIGKFFDVTLDTDLAGENKAQYGADYTATLQKEKGYLYTVRMTIGGKPYSGYGIYDGQYVISGGDITGDIVFTVTKTKIEDTSAKYLEVTIEGSGAGAAEESEQIVVYGGSYTVVLNAEKGYTYYLSYLLPNGNLVELPKNKDGSYVVEKVTEDLVIVVEKVLDIQTSVHTYMNLDEATVFLILAYMELGEGKILTYQGEPMYYSEIYDAWVYLVIGTSTTVETKQFAVQDGKHVQLSTDYDVNASGSVDINDAQLVYDIYNAKHEGFLYVSMRKFLQADINGDKTINVQDVAAVVAKILEMKEGQA